MAGLSGQLKLKMFLMVVLLLVVAAGGLTWYFSYYTKTPDYSIQMIQKAIAKHDTAKFQKYVDMDRLLDGTTDALMQGLIDTDRPMPEEAKAAMSGFARMFKAPIVLSFKGIINHYVETGEWGTDESKTADQGIPIDSDLVLSKSGLKDISFRKVDYVAVDKEAGTAVAGVRIYQAEAADEFVLTVKFVQQEDGVWRATEITNFHEFIVFVTEARKAYMQKYLEVTAPIQERHDKAAKLLETKVSDTLAAGTLGNSNTRASLKKIMLEEVVPEWSQRKADLSGVEVPTAAQTLQRLRIRICDLRIAYAEGYAAWMDDKKAVTIRSADDKLKQARTLEHEADILSAQMKTQAVQSPASAKEDTATEN